MRLEAAVNEAKDFMIGCVLDFCETENVRGRQRAALIDVVLEQFWPHE